ncbi:MAG: molybdopterin-binding protein [Corynebacterium sp.]|nr:molybdopterin-binding protein [Corynebacterium sp.]
MSINFDDLLEPTPEILLAPMAPPRRRSLIILVGEAKKEADLVVELVHEAGFMVDGAVTVDADEHEIRKALETGIVGGTDLILTVGGTGVGPRNKTPDATEAVLDQSLPGIQQALRASGLACGAVDACVSRGVAGISGSTLIVNIAGSRPAIRDGMAMLPPMAEHIIDQLVDKELWEN